MNPFRRRAESSTSEGEASGPPPADTVIDLALRPYVLSGDLSILDPERVRAVQSQALGYDDAVGNVPDGITWSNAVGVHEGPTAELAVALMLAAARHISPAHAALRNGEWKRSKYTGIELYEKTVGIVGLGRIGVLVAQRLSAFGMKVIAFDPYVQAGRAAQMGVRLVDLDTLLA